MSLWLISGYASVFGGPPDDYGHIISRGAFRQSLDEFAARGSLPPMHWEHDLQTSPGRWMHVYEDDKGLFVRGFIEAEAAAAVRALMQVGPMPSFSVGYRRDRATETFDPQTGVRTDHNVDLLEISIVRVAGDKRTHITHLAPAPVGAVVGGLS